MKEINPADYVGEVLFKPFNHVFTPVFVTISDGKYCIREDPWSTEELKDGDTICLYPSLSEDAMVRIRYPK